MPAFEIRRHVDAPAAAVFRAVTDLDLRAEVVPDLVSVRRITPPPLALGTRFVETRVLLGREVAEEFTVVAHEPDRIFAVASWLNGYRREAIFSVEPEHGGSLLSLAVGLRADGWRGVVAVAVWGFVRGWLRKSAAMEVEVLAAEAVAGDGGRF